MATETGVWDLQDVRDKQLASQWTYNAPGGDAGALWTWGSSQYGQLGHNSNTSRSSPMQVGTDTNWDTFSNGGDSHSNLALKSDGTLWAWGKNNNGYLAQNDTANRSSPTQIPGTWSGHSNRGNYHKFAIKSGKLYAWGYNTEGELGLNNRTSISSPTQIGTGTDWSSVDAIDNAGGAAIKTDGSLGQNSLTKYSSPVQIPGTTWKEITSMNYNMYACKTDGTLWAWGLRDKGQLAQNNTAPDNQGRSSPIQIPGKDATFVAGGTKYGKAFVEE